MVRFSLLFSVILLSFDLFSQTVDSIPSADQIIIQRLEDQDEITEDSDVLETIDQIQTEPININTASMDELQQIPVIDAIIAQDIILYRKSNGNFKSISELQNIPSITTGIYQAMIPFVTVFSVEIIHQQKSEVLSNNFGGTIRIRTQSDLQNRNGFTSNKFSGNKYKIYTQQKYWFGDHTRIGFINEKDPGEKDYFDYVNGYFEYKDDDFISDVLGMKVIIGAFKASYGQGLVQWGNTGFGKSSEPVFSVKKSSRGIQPYLSADENSYFSGIGLSGKLINTESRIDFFYSDRKMDGKINSNLIYGNDSEDLTEYISFDLSGLHRDSSETGKKDRISVKTIGANFTQYFTGYGKIGLSMVQLRTGSDDGLTTPPDKSPEKSNRLNSELMPNQSQGTYSLTWDFTRGKYNFYGETAIDDSQSMAWITGLIYKPMNQLAYTVNYRYFDNHFNSFYSRPFKEKTSQPNNERGLYQGVSLTIEKIKLYGYFDYYAFNHSTFSSLFPANGTDWLLGLDYFINSKYSVTVQGKVEESSGNTNITDEWLRENPSESKVKTKSVKMIFNAVLSKNLTSQSKLNFRSYDSWKNQTPDGYSYSQVFKYTIQDYSVNIYYHVFDVTSFDNRIYVFESDLPGLVSSGLLYDKGYRLALVFKSTVFSLLDLSFKISHIQYQDKSSISSGTSLIEGNKLTQWGIQADFRL